MGLRSILSGVFASNHTVGQVTTTRRPKKYSRKFRFASGFDIAELGGTVFEGAEIPIIGIGFAVVGGLIFAIGFAIGLVLLVVVVIELVLIILAFVFVNLWVWLRGHPKHAVVLFEQQLWTRRLDPDETTTQDQLQLDAGHTPEQCGYTPV